MFKLLIGLIERIAIYALVLGMTYCLLMIVTNGWRSWILAYGVLSPFPYLAFQGWASKNLIDTDRIDRYAWWFWVFSLIFAIEISLSHFEYVK